MERQEALQIAIIKDVEQGKSIHMRDFVADCLNSGVITRVTTEHSINEDNLFVIAIRAYADTNILAAVDIVPH
jgi:hypothetical protein